MTWQAKLRKDNEMEDYELEGEQYAEFIMSWVNGGGSSVDANIAWNQGVARRAGYWLAPEGIVDPGFEPPYYMGMSPEEREADNLAFEMSLEFD
jgi:hypothetical protein